MRVLFVHQSFPAQYKHIAPILAQEPGAEVIAIRQSRGRDLPGVRSVIYELKTSKVSGQHRWEPGMTGILDHAEAVWAKARELKAEGFTPDIMLGHNGWGETLFLKDVWPDTPLLSFFEFFYHGRGADTGFDPEFPRDEAVDGPRMRVFNTGNLLGLQAADWGQSPTVWQASRYPDMHRRRISVIHDGIDTDAVRPKPNTAVTLKNGRKLSRQDEVITYVSRNLEPYRGFHTFMRALPDILRRRPNAQVLVVGGDGVSYGSRLAGGKCFREALLEEQKGQIDLERVHFLGQIPYSQFLALLQVSSVHVYLTYPFVLSWSMLEAMSSGCLVIGSATPPVMEAIRDGETGLLTDFFDRKALADRVEEALVSQKEMEPIRAAARQFVVDTYDLRKVCLPRHMSVIKDLVAGREPRPFGSFSIADAVKMARTAADQGDIDRAAGIYQEILRQKPNHRDASEGLAVLLFRAGREEDAVRLLHQAKGQHPPA